MSTREEILSLEDIFYGVIYKKGIPVVSSRYVAKVFGKQHKHILRDIDNMKSNLPPGDIDFHSNFIESQYRASRGRTYREYLLTRSGFILVAMGFIDKKALQFKIELIKKLTLLEDLLYELEEAQEMLSLTELLSMCASFNHEEEQSRFYVIDFGGGLVKIGISKEPEKRARALELQSGRIKKDMYISPELDKSIAQHIETYLKNKLKDHNVNGEYYKYDFHKVVGYAEEQLEMIKQANPQ